MDFIRLFRELNPKEQQEICEYIEERFKTSVEYVKWTPHKLVEEDEVDFYLENSKDQKTLFKNKWDKSRKRVIRRVVDELMSYDGLYSNIYEILEYELNDYIDQVIKEEMKK